jgi:hypothetical protein
VLMRISRWRVVKVVEGGDGSWDEAEMGVGHHGLSSPSARW